MSQFTFSSESVSEGHPDKVCDYISDSILDACFEQDPRSRVACETLVKSDHVVLAGEITTNAKLDYDKIVRQAVKEIGYTDTAEPFCDTTLKVLSLITKQSNEISPGRDGGHQPERRPGRRRPGHHVRLRHRRVRRADAAADPARPQAHLRSLGRSQGQQGRLPPSRQQVAGLGRLRRQHADARHRVVVSTQHTPAADQKRITEYVREDLGPRVLGAWWRADVQLFVNPTGSFIAWRPVGRRRRDRPQDHRRHATAAGAATAAARSAARTRPRSIAAPRTSAATSRARSSPAAWRRRPRFRSATPSAWPSRSR